MAVPKSVTKVSKDGNVTYTTNVEAVEYTIRELCRAALRDTGKFLVKAYRIAFYSKNKKNTGNAGKGCQYWVRSKAGDLQVGLGKKGIGWYAGIMETGSSVVRKQGLLKKTVESNIPKITEIQSQYLSELSKENPNLSGIKEGDYDEEL